MVPWVPPTGAVGLINTPPSDQPFGHFSVMVLQTLAFYNIDVREKRNTEEKLITKMNPKLDDLGISQPIQIEEDDEVRTFTVRKVVYLDSHLLKRLSM